MLLKKAVVFHLICCSCLLFKNQIFAQSTANPLDMLLEKARDQYREHPAEGMAIAKKASELARKGRSSSKHIRALELLAFFSYSEKAYSQAYAYADSAIKIAQHSAIDSLTGDALVTLGSIQSGDRQYRKALNTFQEALEYYHGPAMTGRIATAYLNMGVCERKLGRFERAGKFYISAAEKYQQLNDEPSLADTYNAIGNCCTSATNYAQGIFYHREALRLREKLQDKNGIAQSCSNLGYVLRLDHQAGAAINYLSRALAIRKTDRDSSHLVLTLQNLGAAWKMKGYLNLAKRYIVRSLIISDRYQMKEEQARGTLDMAEVLLAEGSIKAATTYTERAIKTAGRLQIPELLMTAYELRVRIAETGKDHYNAYQYIKRRDLIKDSLLSAAKTKAISELEISYQTKQRKKDIEALTQKNSLEKRVNSEQHHFITLMAISCFLLMLLLGILLVIYRQKVRASGRVQTLHQELHHRVKNNLQILSGLFVMQIDSLSDETAKAALRENESRLTSMNLIHHKLYQDRSTTSIEMKEYLTKLAHHIKDSFGGTETTHIHLEMNIASLELQADKAVAIGLIVNELLTNIFKYSFKDRPGKIVFGLQRSGEREATLLLQDDGPEWKTPVAGEQLSFGLKIVNLMAGQLDTKLELERPGFTSYRMVIRL